MIGTEFIVDEYDNKNELDFSRRLIASYKIPKKKSFWGEFRKLNADQLFPANDPFLSICNSISKRISLSPNIMDNTNFEIGDFLKLWQEFELNSQKNLSYNNNISIYNDIKKFRNKLVHAPQEVTSFELQDKISTLIDMKKGFFKNMK